MELLAPAGNMEKLQIAVEYGADAVYIGGKNFSLRAGAGNFTSDEMKYAAEYVHKKGKKIYLTLNIIPHNDDLISLPTYLEEASEAGIDAIIVSDPGVFMMAKKHHLKLKLHISTQAGITNWVSAGFWNDLGAERLIMARELSINEIKEIKSRLPASAEIEIFVHGSMCISYSGRCLLSNYMTGRDSNRGQCAHPCRWKYSLEEEKRPGEYYPVFEDERGTYIFNSKDLCLIEHIPEIFASGVTSLKIEGRMKSSYYIATVVKAYRQAIDSYLSNPAGYQFDGSLLEEISKASHREYTTGFYFNQPSEKDINYDSSSYIREYDFVGMVKSYDQQTGIALIEQRNNFKVGDIIEVVPPYGPFFTIQIFEMKNNDDVIIDTAPHPQMEIYLPVEKVVPPFTILRRKNLSH